MSSATRMADDIYRAVETYIARRLESSERRIAELQETQRQLLQRLDKAHETIESLEHRVCRHADDLANLDSGLKHLAHIEWTKQPPWKNDQ
jgi:septal ring factor EnvC (AmiA/AmiB activator)